MTQIDNLTNFANQLTVLVLPDGTTANMNLLYNATTERWTVDVSYGTLTINNLGVCCFPNILRPWINLIPFGISCVTADQTDPFNINDFSTGRARLYLLNSDDVQTVESSVFGRMI